VAAFAVLLLAGMGLGLAAYVWNQYISVYDQLGYGENTITIAPTYAACLACNSILLVTAVIGMYGANTKVRSPIAAFIALGYICSVLSIVALGVLFILNELYRLRNTFDILTLAMLAISGVQLILIFVFTMLFCVDREGKIVYEADLSWCGAGWVNTYVNLASLLIGLLGAGVLAYSIIYYLQPEHDVFEETVKNYKWVMVAFMVTGGVELLFCLGGVFGTKLHSQYLLFVFMLAEGASELFQLICAFLLLSSVNVENSLLTLSMVVLIISGLQLALLFFVCVLYHTDKESLYQAEYI